MFLSPLFAQAFATVTKTIVQLYNTDGSQGAARGAGIGAGIYKGAEDAFVGLTPVKTIEPDKKLAQEYKQAYENWENVLNRQLSGR
jgi:xylulokinase